MNLTPILPILFLATALGVQAASTNPSPDAFRSPPVQARPMVYWDWITGNVNREAITRDLEHMKRVGLGGGLLFDVPPLNSENGYAACAPEGPVPFMSDEWLDLVNFAAEESHRLGLDFGVVLCEGWNTGGPWIKPKDNNQLTAQSMIRVSGPQKEPVVLPAPSTDPDYVDVAVVAWPTPDNESHLMAAHPPTITVNGKPGNQNQLRAMMDDDRESSASVPSPKKNAPTVIEFTFAEPVTVDHFYIQEEPRFGIKAGRLEADLDGVSKKLGEFETEGSTPIEVSFDPVTAKTFRLVATAAQRLAETGKNMRLDEVALMEPGKAVSSAPEIRNWMLKTSAHTALGKKRGERLLPNDHLEPTPDIAGMPVLAPKSVLTLTDKLGADGKLTWDVPAGDWTIMRFGMVPTHSHTYNYKCRKGNEDALESDKMSADASRLHYQSMAGAIFKHLSPEGRKGLDYFHLDSWEGEENLWTKGFLAEFKKRRGYDLAPYLPVFEGKIVGDGPTSDRVLWDYRRTIGDLNIANHFKTLADLCHADGVKLSAQAGHGFQANMDAIGSISQADYPSGEFWNSGRNNRRDVRNSVKDAASTVNVYGKPYGLFESFTTGQFPNFWPSPFDLKKLGDNAMAEGVSRMFIHGMWLDPVVNNKPPGTSWSAGIHVGPSITWMPDGRAFFDYLARCQYLLQSGVADKDVLYFYGDGMPNITPKRDELPFTLPAGRDYDATDSRAIRELISVKDGKLTLPHGATYRTLVLPPLDTMLPETLEAVSRLVKDGAVVVGPKPLRSPSLSSQPEADAKLSRLADELWGENPPASGSKQTGKGTVHWGTELAAVFTAHTLPPQIEVRGGDKGTEVEYLNRQTLDGRDFYFLASQGEAGTDVEILFRSAGKRPFFWQPDTGEITPAPVCATENGRTRIPLHFAPYGSVFVVFGPEKNDEPAAFTKIEKDGAVLFPSDGKQNLPLTFTADGKEWKISATEKGRYTLTGSDGKTSTLDATAPEVIEAKGPWQVAFEKDRGAPGQATFDELKSWTAETRPGIKYFSGYGTYTRTVDVPEAMTSKNRRVILDLGQVGDVAHVKVNGKDFGTLWKPPFRVDVTDAIKPGKNELEIAVVNTWVNRLIGDDKFPKEKPVANTLARNQIPAADLEKCPSGLLGPVTLEAY